MAPLPDSEGERLAGLRGYNILDTPPDPVFDDLTRLAAQVCDAPIALIGLVDQQRLWFKARVGLEIHETPRDISFCAHTICQHDLLVVPDATLDERFANNPLVTSEPYIRFYAGVPLLTAAGHALGTLCVIDRFPRRLKEEQFEALRVLARHVLRELELRRTRRDLQRAEAERSEASDLALSLRLREERLRALVDSMAVGVIYVDAAGIIESCNASAARIAGVPADQLVGLSIFDPRWQVAAEDGSRMAPEDLPAAVSLRTGRPFTNVVLQSSTPSGARVWLSVNTQPLRQAGASRPHAVIVNYLDVTERKRAEDALRESERRFRDLFDHSPDAIFVEDLDGTVLDVNPAACRLHGMTAAELVGKNVLELVPADQREEVARQFPSLTRGDLGTVEGYSATKDGRTVPVELRVSHIHYAARPAVLLHVRDITQRLQLRQAQKMEAIGQLAAGVAHDFNNLLTVVFGCSDMLMMTLAAGDSRRNLVGEIQQAAEAAASLTRQLLAFSRKQMLEPKVVDLNELVRQVEKLLRRLIGEDINLSLVLDPELSRVRVDPSQIEQVVVNLAVNARDAMPQGGRLTIETRNRCVGDLFPDEPDLAAGPYVLLSVCDTGCGMSPATKAHIFEPFFTTKGARKGVGLGLATVYGIVKQSGGHILVESSPGAGTAVHVFLPPVADELTPAVPSECPREQRGVETILLVEDDPAVRKVGRLTLERLGYRVLAAPGGPEALAIADTLTEPLQLLVTDVVMPEMSGRQLAERLRHRCPHLKVLYMSGYTDDAVIRHGVVETPGTLLLKPFAPQTLAERVRAILDRASS